MQLESEVKSVLSRETELFSNASKGRHFKKNLLEFRINRALSARSYSRGGSRIQIPARRSRGVEGVYRKHLFNKVTSEENRKYISLISVSSSRME